MTVSTTGVVQWTPGNTVTTADVTLEVIDGGEDGTVAAVQSWTITVGSVNDSPEITSVAIVTATEDMVYQYPVQVTDPDDANNGTDLTFELTTAPAGMTVSSMGLIEWTPTNDDVSVPVTVVVRDGGESGSVPATQSWTIAVTPVNDAPEITQGATTTLSVEEDTLASLGLNATDIDTAATSLTWSVSSVAVNGVASVTGTGSSKSVSYTPNADFNGSDEITTSTGFTIKKEKLFSQNKYISLDLAVKILNLNGALQSYKMGNKYVSLQIDISTAKIGAFPYMFSTKPESLVIPGDIPDFSAYFLNTSNVSQQADGVLSTDANASLPPVSVPAGSISFVQKKPLTPDMDGSGLKEKENYWGYLKNLYVNYDMFVEKLNQPNKTIREVLLDILNETAQAGEWRTLNGGEFNASQAVGWNGGAPGMIGGGSNTPVVATVDEMIKSQGPVRDINDVNINVVPDFSKLMGALKEKGSI